MVREAYSLPTCIWRKIASFAESWSRSVDVQLHYVKSAFGVTDVPDQVPELISQRRRWLNGSFFAAIHSTFHFYYIYRSSHSLTRKFWIHVEMAYQFLNLIFSWFALVRQSFPSPFSRFLIEHTGKLLYRILHSIFRLGRPSLRPQWDSYREHLP